MRDERLTLVLGTLIAFAPLACGSDKPGGAGTGGAGGSQETGGSSGSGGTSAGGSSGSGGTSAGGSSGSGVGLDAGGDAAPTTDGSPSGDATGGDSDGGKPSDGGTSSALGFFVTSIKSMTGNLGGLTGADKRCQDLAAQVGAGGRTWHAYLSADKGPDGMPVNAADRIGKGPWYNSKGALVAMTVADLHTKQGNYMLFVDEKGAFINGQWQGSPMPNEHDILTGSNKDGTLMPGKTCKDWTSAAMTDSAQVGHSDGLGPMRNMAAPYNSWNSAHENGGCNDTAPRGGSGRIYCFAID